MRFGHRELSFLFIIILKTFPNTGRYILSRERVTNKLCFWARVGNLTFRYEKQSNGLVHDSLNIS